MADNIIIELPRDSAEALHKWLGELSPPDATWQIELGGALNHALKGEKWWITTTNIVNDQTKVAGPFDTYTDALTARSIKEQYSDGQTYWVMER